MEFMARFDSFVINKDGVFANFTGLSDGMGPFVLKTSIDKIGELTPGATYSFVGSEVPAGS